MMQKDINFSFQKEKKLDKRISLRQKWRALSSAKKSDIKFQIFAGICSCLIIVMLLMYNRSFHSVGNAWSDRESVVHAFKLPVNELEATIKNIYPEAVVTKEGATIRYEMTKKYDRYFVENMIITVTPTHKTISLKNSPIEYLEERVTKIKKMMRNVSQVTIDYKRTTADVSITEEL